MWNCGAFIFWPATRPVPSPTWTNTATSANTVNHHRARVRSAGHWCAPRAHRPARPLPMMTTHAQPLWMASRVARGNEETLRGRGGLAVEGLGVGLGGRVDELADLVVGEPGQAPELAGQVD